MSKTDIPLSQRLTAIVQLCFSFSLLLWHLFQPFMGEYYLVRSRMLIYEYVMGTSSMTNSTDHILRFGELPEHDKQLLLADYEKMQEYVKRPFLKKIEGGIRSLIRDIPPFEQAWIYFSITIAILILLRKEGANLAAWLLPLLTIAFAVDNFTTGKPATIVPDSALFPSEEHIVQNYLKEPLGTYPHIQKEQLEKGWQRYLIENWSTEKGNDDSQKLVEAEYNFTLARVKLLHTQPLLEWLDVTHKQLSWLNLSLYLLWNVCFALIVSKPSILTNVVRRNKLMV